MKGINLINRNNVVQIFLSVTILAIALVNLYWTWERDRAADSKLYQTRWTNSPDNLEWRFYNGGAQPVFPVWTVLTVRDRRITTSTELREALGASEGIKDATFFGDSQGAIFPKEERRLFNVSFGGEKNKESAKLIRAVRVEMCFCTERSGCTAFVDAGGLPEVMFSSVTRTCPAPPAMVAPKE